MGEPSDDEVSNEAWPRGSNPLVEGQNYEFVDRPSSRLWVILGPRDMAPGRFAYYASGLLLPGSVLFVSTLKEDFYQGMLDELAAFIAAIARRRGIADVVYAGFSAGAFAALALGLKDARTRRILAFSPQFTLNYPLSIGQRTIARSPSCAARFNRRLLDILPLAKASAARCDVFLGLYDLADGYTLEQASQIDNANVRVHYVRYEHSVTVALSRAGQMPGIFAAAESGAEVELPAALCGDAVDARFSARLYRMALDMENGKLVALPDDDDDGYVNPQWWNLKARIRHKAGDKARAAGDIARAIALDPAYGDHFLVGGHIFRDLNIYRLAEACYRSSAQLNPKNWQGPLALADIFAISGDRPGAELALDEAKKRGAPERPLANVAAKLPPSAPAQMRTG